MAKERDYKHEYQLQKKRGKAELEKRMRRQNDRREFDKKHTGKRTVKAPEREGMHISHEKTNARGSYKLEKPSTNSARNYSKGRPKGAKNRK